MEGSKAMKVSRLWFFLVLGLTVVAGLLMPTAVQAAPPPVTAVTPNQGQQGQTLAVTIIGDNLTGASSVSFGPEITVNGFTPAATQISASITIDHYATEGTRDVSVTVGGETGTLINGFTVTQAPPIVNSVTPATGIQGQSLSVTISGDYFAVPATVDFGPEITVASSAVDNATQISASLTIADYATVGTCNVTVTVGALTGTLTDGFTVDQAPPVVDSVTPDTGAQGQSLPVVVNGDYFDGVTAVDFGPGITVDNFTVGLFGLGDVQIGTGTYSVDFPFNTWWMDARTQSILLASEIGQAGHIYKVSLYCTGRPGQDLSHFYIRMQHTTMSSFSGSLFVNSGWTTVLHATNVNVSTWTEGGWVEFTLTTPFAYNGTDNLLIDYCYDNSYYTSDGYCRYTSTSTCRTITDYTDLPSGNLLDDYSGARQYWYNNVVLAMDSTDALVANITVDESAALGLRDVSVTTPGGTTVLPNAFTVIQPPPVIASISPSEGVVGETYDVTITGTDLNGATSVTFGPRTTVNSFNVDSETQITANITIDPDAIPGANDVSVTTPGGTAYAAHCFTVYGTPYIETIIPARGMQGENLNVDIVGLNFLGATAISFGPDITVNSFQVVSPTQIQVNIKIDSQAAAGLRDVSVTAPAGTATSVDGFLVMSIPIVNSVTFNEGSPGETLNVSINGAHFDDATRVTFGWGIVVNSYTVVSSTSIAADITIEDGAFPGMRDVSVSTPRGTGTLENGFNVLAVPPAIAEIDDLQPASGLPGEEIEIVISGTNFTGATEVSFGEGITVHSFTVDSDTQITAIVDIGRRADVGARDVTVTTPEGTETFPAFFTVEAPPSSLPLYVWLLAGFGAAAVLGVGGIVVWRKKLAH
jgi:hypothetical protein